MIKHKISNGIYFIPQKRAICVLSNNSSIDNNDINNIIEKYVPPVIPYNSAPNNSNSGHFVPLHIDIFPTYECNLRCKYCYAGTGDFNPRSLSQKQIDTILKELSKTARMKYLCTGMKEKVDAEIMFAGGGEPTCKWDIFEYAIEQSKKMSKEYNYNVNLGLVTNGFIYDSKKIKYICDNFKYIQVSVDGLACDQDFHRPTAESGSSSEIVYDFIRKCSESGKKVGLRMTVSDYTVANLSKSIEFFAREFPMVSHVQVEPLSINNKSKKNELNPPNAEIFVEEYFKSLQVGRKERIGVISSVANFFSIRHNDSFCDAVLGNSLILNPDGYLTTCYEASTEVEEVSTDFFSGKIDHEGNVTWYNTFSRHQKPTDSCKQCIAWEFCKGGCVASMLRSEENRKYHCSITKAIFRKVLLEIAYNLNANLNFSMTVVNWPSEKIKQLIYWTEEGNITKLKLANIG